MSFNEDVFTKEFLRSYAISLILPKNVYSSGMIYNPESVVVTFIVQVYY